MKDITEAQLIIKMQELVIKHLEEGNDINTTISIIQTNGAVWRQRATKILNEMEAQEGWLHAERVGHPVSFQEVLQDCLKVVEKNIEEITELIENGE